MPFLDEVGLQTFWENCKDKFGNKLKVTQNATTVDVALQTVDEEDLATGTIPQASTTAAGVMTAADKEKLNGIESGATANSGTITEVKGSDPIIGSGTQGSVTLSHADSGVADGTYGDDSATPVTPSFGSTFNVPGFAVNDKGHVTSASTHTVKIPNSVASQAADGLMSQEDKTKLDGIADGATANVGTITGVSASSPLSGGGNSGNVTISHINSGVTAGTYGDSTNQTPGFGETFKVNSETVNATGHITAASSHTVTIPDTIATEDTSGLMSAEDKAKLNGIQAGAGQYTLPVATYETLGGVRVRLTVDTDYVTENQDHLMYVVATDSSTSKPGLLVFPASNEFDIDQGVLGISLISGDKIYDSSLLPDKIAGTIPDSKLQAISANKITGTIPQSILPSYVDDVLEYANKSSFPGTGEAGKIYVDLSTNLTYRWGGSSYIEISPSLALGTTSSTAFRGDYGNTAYQHATAKGSAFASGLYKITTNAQGHVTAATAVTKSDITALGIPGQDTNTTYSAATTSTAGLMSAADKTKLDGIASGANRYTLPAATTSALGGVRIGFPESGKNYPVELNDSNQMFVNVPWTDTNTTYTLSSFGITATAAELNKLDGVTATATEINYLDGVTSAIQTQLNSKASSSHTHSIATTSAAGFLPKLGGGTTNFLRADGTWAKPPDTNTTYSTMKGATSSAAGRSGLVPAPAAGSATRYLRCDGTWQVPPDTNTTYTLSSFGITATAAELNKLDGVTATAAELNYVDGVTSNIQTQLNGKAATSHSHSAATTSANGFMTAAMVTKLNGIATGANKYTLPTASSSTLGGVKVGSNLTISSGVLTAKVASDADFKAYMGIS